MTDPVHLHQSYWTKPVALAPSDAEDLHRLGVAVNWPHRLQDMELLLGIGRGLIARDDIGRALGTGMCFAYGAGEARGAMIGMMMTHPKLQSGGLGARILAELEETVGTSRLRLNATRTGWPLYRSVGFKETGRVMQYQGTVRPDFTAPEDGPRRADPSEFDAIAELDAETFGVSRKPVLDLLQGQSEVVVQSDQGRITGFAFCRLFGRGHLIGPLSAASEDDAITLAQSLLVRHRGSFVRLDADARHRGLAAFLNEAGLESFDTVTPMTKGAGFGPEAHPTRVYALASQALG